MKCDKISFTITSSLTSDYFFNEHLEDIQEYIKELNFICHIDTMENIRVDFHYFAIIEFVQKIYTKTDFNFYIYDNDMANSTAGDDDVRIKVRKKTVEWTFYNRKYFPQINKRKFIFDKKSYIELVNFMTKELDKILENEGNEEIKYSYSDISFKSHVRICNRLNKNMISNYLDNKSKYIVLEDSIKTKYDFLSRYDRKTRLGWLKNENI